MALEKFDLDAYAYMLLEFKRRGYQSIKFQDIDVLALEHKVVFRHDVDVSVEGALALAEVEHEHKIVSTYYFLLTSPLYNMLSKEVSDQVLRIFELGHDIALHFNPYFYGPGALKHIEKELEILGAFYPYANLEWVSFHRPGAFAGQLSQIKLPNGIRHTYEPVFFETMAYYSDSRGLWSYGHPLESAEYKAGKGMQVLTHPIWWYHSKNSPEATVIDHADRTREELLRQIRSEIFPESNPGFM